MAEVTVSMINKRGRIVGIDKRELSASLEAGLRVFPNPKEKYYPEYDEEYTKPKDQPTLPNEVIERRLEVFVL